MRERFIIWASAKNVYTWQENSCTTNSLVTAVNASSFDHSVKMRNAYRTFIPLSTLIFFCDFTVSSSSSLSFKGADRSQQSLLTCPSRRPLKITQVRLSCPTNDLSPQSPILRIYYVCIQTSQVTYYYLHPCLPRSTSQMFTFHLKC